MIDHQWTHLFCKALSAASAAIVDFSKYNDIARWLFNEIIIMYQRITQVTCLFQGNSHLYSEINSGAQTRTPRPEPISVMSLPEFVLRRITMGASFNAHVSVYRWDTDVIIEMSIPSTLKIGAYQVELNVSITLPNEINHNMIQFIT